MVGGSACLIFSCTMKSRSRFLLAPGHPGSPWKRAVNWLCLCVRISGQVSDSFNTCERYNRSSNFNWVSNVSFYCTAHWMQVKYMLLYLCLTLCIVDKWSKSFDEWPHCTGNFSLGKCDVTLECFYSRPVWMLVDSMQANPNIGPTGNGSGQRAGKILTSSLLKNAPSLGGSGSHLIHSSLGPPNSMSQMVSRSV